jgi:NADH:ubiquinone oxidoreductase subunit E
MKAEDTELLKEFTKEHVVKLNSIIEKFKGKPGGLIPVLEEAQVALEYLPISVQKRIASGLNLPLSRVYGVVTFYSFFTMTPRGKHTVRVCLGTACYVRGGKALTQALEKQFGIKEGETTPDRMFTLESVRCLGACGLGPVVVVDEDVHGRCQAGKN